MVESVFGILIGWIGQLEFFKGTILKTFFLIIFQNHVLIFIFYVSVQFFYFVFQQQFQKYNYFRLLHLQKVTIE